MSDPFMKESALSQGKLKRDCHNYVIMLEHWCYKYFLFDCKFWSIIGN